jgi:hypothetical protein
MEKSGDQINRREKAASLPDARIKGKANVVEPGRRWIPACAGMTAFLFDALLVVPLIAGIRKFGTFFPERKRTGLAVFGMSSPGYGRGLMFRPDKTASQVREG